MSRSSKTGKISRRGFLKGMGSGIAGSYMLIPGLSIAAGKISEELGSDSENLQVIKLKVNGRLVKVHVQPHNTLAEVLRERLKLTGTKIVCNNGECGSCTVLMDGKAVYSCHTLALDAAGREVTTIENLMKGETLHPIQEAFIEHDGIQCGFCTPGQIMAAQALLNKYPKPSREQVLEGMSGNICRCAAYPGIINSVLAAAEKEVAGKDK